jgi:uroporphyrinogen decarboxylase
MEEGKNMSSLSKRERVDAALKGEAADRVPVSAWRHCIPEELNTESLAQISLRHFNTFDWDWLKVNPRATYYAEAWGNRYDYNQYDVVLPRLVEGPLNTPADLEKISEVHPTGGVFAEQLDLIRRIKAGINGAHFVQTVFSPLSVLAFLAARPQTGGMDAASQAQYNGVRALIRENPDGVHNALRNITAALAKYAAAAVDAGASGLFFAIVKLARKDVLSREEYAAFGQPYDLEVLQAVQGAPFNLLHICGPQAYFDIVNEYPVHAVNWAAIGQNNPDIREAARQTNKALIGGVDELGALQSGSPEAVTEEALAAIRATGGRRLLLSPGCGTSMNVPDANLHALRSAADLAAINA